MRIKKYDFDYGRRFLMEKVAKGIATGGVIAPLWPLIAKGASLDRAYPDELVHIEANTKGRVKIGDMISADNLEHVQHLLDPIRILEIKTMGRKMKVVSPSTHATETMPLAYYEATLRNFGKAKWDSTGNVVNSDDGGPWIGGNPFPEPKNGVETIANLTLSWGRHDMSRYAMREWDLNTQGDALYTYDFVWNELNTAARVGKNRYFEGHKDLLRYQGVFFTAPQDTAGSSFLCPWYYDQRKFPDLYGYLPAFKRVRQFPTNQRFEPIMPGMGFFLSDAWGVGDPMLTWGNYKIISRGPYLVPLKGNWFGARHPNWEPTRMGGPKGTTFFETCVELVPECILVEAEPTNYPRAPVGKKRVWVDSRSLVLSGYNTYDRRGQLWKSVDASFGQKIDGKVAINDRQGHPEWSWHNCHFHDVQTGTMSLLVNAREVTGGYTMSLGDPDEFGSYNKFLTASAIQRLGSA